MSEAIRDGDGLLIEHDPAAQRIVRITEQDGMTVIRIDYYGAAALREKNAEAEKVRSAISTNCVATWRRTRLTRCSEPHLKRRSGSARRFAA
jgi:hypothetical protein